MGKLGDYGISGTPWVTSPDYGAGNVSPAPVAVSTPPAGGGSTANPAYDQAYQYAKQNGSNIAYMPNNPEEVQYLTDWYQKIMTPSQTSMMQSMATGMDPEPPGYRTASDDPNVSGHSYEGNQVRTYYRDGTSSLGPITGEKSGNWLETGFGDFLGEVTPYLAGGAMLAGGLTAAGIGPLAGAGATGAAGAGAGAVGAGAAGLTAAEIAAIQGVGSAAGAQATAGITGGTLAGAGILGAGAGMAMAPSGFGAAEIGTGAAGAAGAGVAGAGAAGVAGAAGAGALTGLSKSLTDTLIGLGIPLTVAGVASYLSGEQQSEAGSEAYDKQIAAASALYDKQLAASKEATLQAQEFWKQNAFMSPEAVDAYKKQGMAGLNALTETSQRNFLDASAARGFRGGGILTSGLADIERSRQKQYGGFLNELTQYANTPTFAPSGAPYSVPSSSIPSAIPSISGEQNLYNLLGGVGGMASGLGLYEYLYGKR